MAWLNERSIPNIFSLFSILRTKLEETLSGPQNFQQTGNHIYTTNTTESIQKLNRLFIGWASIEQLFWQCIHHEASFVDHTVFEASF